MKTVTDIFKKMEILKEQIDQWGLDLFVDLDELPLGISVVNDVGIIQRVNKEFCQLSGYTAEELKGKHFTMLVPEEQANYMKNLHKKFIETPFDLSGTYEIVPKQGKPFELLLSSSLLTKEGGKMRVSLSTKLEYTDSEFSRKMEEKLEVLNSFLKSFEKKLHEFNAKLQAQDTAAGIVRHDLKNQLKNIVAIGHLLQNEEDLSAEQEKLTEMMVRSAEKALRDIENAKNIDLLEQGKYTPDFEQFDLLEMLEKIHERLHILFDSKELKLLVQSDNPKFEKPHRAPYYIRGDRIFMEMCLTNLIQNAVEASPEKETILININAGMAVEINIHNWGIVPIEVRDHFFDKYVTAGKRKGTGLGTYICKLIVEAHDGMISMKTSEKEGTYIVMSFPFHCIMQKSA